MDETNDTQDVVLDNNDEENEEKEPQKPEPSQREKELEAEAAKWRRIAERNAKKADSPTSPEPKETRSSDLDYGQKAFLRSYDIKGSDELELVRTYMERTGDTLDSVVEDDIFTAKLTKLREAKAAADAVPKGTRRSQAPATDEVSYWTGKVANGLSLNDIPDVSMRRKVLNARIEQERVGSRFSDTPVSMG
jgi:hypothetical protein